jgi:hypothetical protein
MLSSRCAAPQQQPQVISPNACTSSPQNRHDDDDSASSSRVSSDHVVAASELTQYLQPVVVSRARCDSFPNFSLWSDSDDDGKCTADPFCIRDSGSCDQVDSESSGHGQDLIEFPETSTCISANVSSYDRVNALVATDFVVELEKPPKWLLDYAPGVAPPQPMPSEALGSKAIQVSCNLVVLLH